MAKRPSAASRRPHWTEADARGVLAEWERNGKTLEEVLDPARFCRIHRSAIVNLARAAAIECRDYVLGVRMNCISSCITSVAVPLLATRFSWSLIAIQAICAISCRE